MKKKLHSISNHEQPDREAPSCEVPGVGAAPYFPIFRDERTTAGEAATGQNGSPSLMDQYK
ncbi:MAG TPA: hypothetical protein VF335_06550 [Chitinivibrionales bacterium]